MKHHTAKGLFKRILKSVCGVAVMLVLAASITAIPAYAAENGIYLATATPHYKHPTTGVIEDAGGDGSAVLGQSMTESATYTKALVEVDADGRTYVTVRLKLMDNIQSPTFQVDGKSVSASCMQEDYSNNTADFRMRVGSEHSVIRCSMYVVPMRRQVIFYITVSNLQSGSGDFITSIPAPQPKPAQSTETPSAPSDTPSTPAAAEPETPAATEPETPVTEPETPAGEDATPPDDTEPTGLQEFDASGNRIGEETATHSGSGAVWWIVGGAVIVAAAGFAVWYFGFFRKKQK